MSLGKKKDVRRERKREVEQQWREGSEWWNDRRKSTVTSEEGTKANVECRTLRTEKNKGGKGALQMG
jgi:hypothetical protein